MNMPPEIAQTPVKTPKTSKLPWILLSGVSLVLLIVIGVIVALWKPWQANIKASDRTISVTGDATVTAEPDEYVFSPSYTFKNADKQAALDEMSKKSDAVVAKLKSLGVGDKKIQTNSNGYAGGIYYPVDGSDGTQTYTLTLTITLNDKTLTQKVQDYLVTTGPTGEISPIANFSDAKTKALQSQARGNATKDARTKADQSAKNLGFKVSRVKSVDDSSGFGGPINYAQSSGANSLLTKDAGAPSPSLSVQPGENKLSYSVTVVYYIH